MCPPIATITPQVPKQRIKLSTTLHKEARSENGRDGEGRSSSYSSEKAGAHKVPAEYNVQGRIPGIEAAAWELLYLHVPFSPATTSRVHTHCAKSLTSA